MHKEGRENPLFYNWTISFPFLIPVKPLCPGIAGLFIALPKITLPKEDLFKNMNNYVYANCFCGLTGKLRDFSWLKVVRAI